MHKIYSGREESVRFACFTIVWSEGKQTHPITYTKDITTMETRHPATMYCSWEIFIAWTVYAYLSATPSTPSDSLPLISNGR